MESLAVSFYMLLSSSFVVFCSRITAAAVLHSKIIELAEELKLHLQLRFVFIDIGMYSISITFPMRSVKVCV